MPPALRDTSETWGTLLYGGDPRCTSNSGLRSTVAKILNMKPARVYELARLKIVVLLGVVVRFGRQLRFNLDALEQHIARGGTALPGGWRAEPQADVA